jgi:hypothetical protein
MVLSVVLVHSPNMVLSAMVVHCFEQFKQAVLFREIGLPNGNVWSH